MFYYFIKHFKNTAFQIFSRMLNKFIFPATEIICFVHFLFSFCCHIFYLSNRPDLFIVANYLSSSCCLVNYIFHLFFYLCLCCFFALTGFYSGIYKPFLFLLYLQLYPQFHSIWNNFFLWLHVLNELLGCQSRVSLTWSTR